MASLQALPIKSADVTFGLSELHAADTIESRAASINGERFMANLSSEVVDSAISYVDTQHRLAIALRRYASRGRLFRKLNTPSLFDIIVLIWGNIHTRESIERSGGEQFVTIQAGVRSETMMPYKKNNLYRYYGERKRTKLPSPNGRWVAAIAAGVRFGRDAV